MTSWVAVSFETVAGALAAVFLLIALVQAWMLRRVHRTIKALQPLDERVSRLSYSIGLLVDTTQGCFDALATQVGRKDDHPRQGFTASMPPPVEGPALPAVAAAATEVAERRTPPRQQRQRRVVGAAKRGQSVGQIAAREAMSEGEVALRMQLARELQGFSELS